MATDPSSDKLLEWNKEEIGLFEESKTKPSHLTSLATQEFEKRTSKRQARKMSKSIKDHMTQTGSNQEALFKPHMNLNPLVETSSKAGSAEEPKNDVDALNSKDDPEVVKSKKTKKAKGETENVMAVVNEFFDEEEPPRGDGELPDPPPVELTTIDETKEDTNERNEPDDNTTDNNGTDMEPPITNNGENGTTQNPKIVSVDEDKATDMQPSPTSKDAPVSENIKAEEAIDEIHTTTVNEEQTLVTEQEVVITVTNEEDAEEGEVKGTNGDADNVPLIDVKKSTTKTPSSPGKFGLRVKLV